MLCLKRSYIYIFHLCLYFFTLSTQAISGLFSVDIGDVCTCFSDVVMAFGSKHCVIPSETHSMVSRTNIRDLPRKLSRADRVLLLTNRTDLCFVIFMICKELNICKNKKNKKNPQKVCAFITLQKNIDRNTTEFQYLNVRN